jgi:hypothetical protein
MRFWRGWTGRDSADANRGQPVARIPFTDRVEREAFQDMDDRLFVVDDDGDAVYGYWVVMDDPEEPLIEEAE